MKRAPALTRAQDEKILQWLAWRSAGYSARAIARHVDAAPGVVVKATNAVRAADLAESGEDVSAGYWA